MAVPLKEQYPQLFFQGPYLQGKSRLAEMDDLCGLSEVEVFCHCQEVSQLSKIHLLFPVLFEYSVRSNLRIPSPESLLSHLSSPNYPQVLRRLIGECGLCQGMTLVVPKCDPVRDSALAAAHRWRRG